MPDLWRPLLVSNPLTKQWKVLPSPPDVMSASWDYHGARVHLVVDEGANAYTVVLLFRLFVCVYKSTTQSWSSSKFVAPIQWGFRSADIVSTAYVDAATALMGGKLYYVELEAAGSTMPVHRDHMDVEMLTNGQLKVFEVDYNEGTWEPVGRYALKDHIPRHVQDISDFGFEIGSYAIGVVECMGGMYVLIPACLDISVAVPDDVRRQYDLKSGTAMTTYRDFGFLPLRFYILPLQGNGMPFGQAFVQTSEGMSKWEYSKRIDMASHECNLKYNPHFTLFPTNCSSWYRYRSWGSIVSIVFSDYIVQFDVMSGRSTTRITPAGMIFKQFEPYVSYRPSFIMKP